MTLDQALTISSTRTVDLWRLCVGEHAGWSPDSLREQALDILTCEAERLLAVLAAARLVANEEHDRRVNDCLDLHVMTKERDTLREQLKVIVAEHADCCFDEGCTAIEEVRNLVATFDAEARQKGTPT